MEFEIEVISDAGASIFGQRVPILGAASKLAAHDLAMAKPALLYADRVTLYSGNYFIGAQLQAFQTRAHMPLQAVALIANLARRGRDQLATIGIGSDDLPTVEDARASMEAWGKSVERAESDPDFNFVAEFVVPLADRWEQFFPRVLPRLVEALQVEQQQLFSEELTAAVDAGLLKVVPHTLDPPNPNTSPHDILFGEEPTKYQDRAAAEMLIRSATSSGAVLLDPWGNELSEVFGLRPDGRRSVAADLGTELLGRLPTVRNASVAEILDLRKELGDALVRFRGAVAAAAREAPASAAGE